MKKITLFMLAALTSAFSYAQFQDDFDPSPLSGWVLAQGAQIKSTAWPAGTASGNAITTSGAGGNAPARILTPVVSKTGATVQICLDIWLMNSNYNGVVSLPCATTMNVQFIKSTVSTIQDVDVPSNILATIPGGVTLPTTGGQTCFQFTFPASVTDANFRMLINFTAPCNQSSNKFVIDNTQISGVINTGCGNSVNGCGASDNNCPPQPLGDNFSISTNSENSWSGVLYGQNASYPDMGSSYKVDVNGNDGDANNGYNQLQWSLVPGSVSPAGVANVVVNSNGTFSFTRTNLGAYSISFSYNLSDNGLDNIAGNCDDRSATATVTISYPVPTQSLPVKWTSFDASVQNGSVVLNWTTAQELNSKGFEVERKLGDGAFSSIGFVAARSAGGTLTASTRYQFTDPEPIGDAVRYYRLREVSVDNEYTYSDVQVVRGKQSGFDVLVYPNPAKEGKANISLPQGNAVYNISLQDVNGRVIGGWKSAGGIIPVTNVPRGLYFIQVRQMTTGEKKVQKLLVP